MGSSGFLLPLEPRGLYREMLTQAWRRGASLPEEPELIRRACGVTVEEWDRCWPLVSKYWQHEDGQIFNETQREVYAEAANRKMKAVEKASNAAQARWNASSNASSNAQAEHKHMLEQCPPSPSLSPSLSQSPSPSPKEQTVPVNGQYADDIAAVFEHFRKQHPRAKLTASRKTLIRTHLQAGYSVEDLQTALDGLHLDRWHIDNGNLTLEYGLRNGNKIDGFIEIASNPSHPKRADRPRMGARGDENVRVADAWLRRGTNDL